MNLFCLKNIYRKHLTSFCWWCWRNSGFWADIIVEIYHSLLTLLSDEFLVFIERSHRVLLTVLAEISFYSQHSIIRTILWIVPTRVFSEEFVEFSLIVSVKLRLCSRHFRGQLRIWCRHIEKLGGVLQMEFKVEHQMTFSTSRHLLS